MLTEEQIKYMASRFCGWKLPENFRPDNGITFNPLMNERTPQEMKRDPSGTNLFDIQQAEEMVRYMAEGVPTNEIEDGSTKHD